jgi:hypothetical protein
MEIDGIIGENGVRALCLSRSFLWLHCKIVNLVHGGQELKTKWFSCCQQDF